MTHRALPLPLLQLGKESKKRQWHQFYAVLTGPTMFFFANEKDKRKGKKASSFVEVGDKLFEEVAHDKKKFTFVLGNDRDRCRSPAADPLPDPRHMWHAW